MTDNTRRDRTRAIRAHMAEHNVKWTEAARAVDAAQSSTDAPGLSVISFEVTHPQGFGGHDFGYVAQHDLFRCDHCGGYEVSLRNADTGEIRPCPKNATGLTPPPGWRTGRFPAMASTFHDGTVRTVQIRDAHTQELIAETTAPYRNGRELIAEYDAAGLINGTPGADFHTASVRTVGLGRPDLIVHQIGYDAGQLSSEWTEWPDGSWRAPAKPLPRRHVATLVPVSAFGGRTLLTALTIREYPGGSTVVEQWIDRVDPEEHRVDLKAHDAIAQILNQLGYTTERYGWQSLPGGERYALALPGHLAERTWLTEAKVKITKEYKAAAPEDRTGRHYRVGDEVQLMQWGRAGEEVDRTDWWTSMDIDGALIIPADHLDIVEVLEEIPAFWAQAALPAHEVLGLIGPHHDGADAAVAAWYAAELVVARVRGGLQIYTPAPEYRPVGQLARDYWDGAAGHTNRYTDPYEAVIDPEKTWLNRKLDHLPHDPVAAAAPRIAD